MLDEEVIQQLLDVARNSLQSSYSPYSSFPVGAALLDSSGKIWGGCNVENASYGATVCAERTAILKSVSEGSQEFRAILVMTPTERPTPPCALCLQVMAEFCKPEMPVYLANETEVKSSFQYSELLAYPFGPAYLLEEK